MVVAVQCAHCSKTFLRPSGRYNEAIKFKWKQYCSDKCQFEHKTSKAFIVCSRPGCGKKFFRQQNQIRIVVASYCSTSCSAKVNNLAREKKIRECANPKCLGKFTGKNKYCSIKCIPYPISKYTKESVMSELQSFVQKTGRIPMKQEFMRMNKPARKYFGTWNNAIKAAGYEPNPVMFAKKYVALDGHKCDSLVERIIDDYLSRRKIPHRRSVPYPGFKGYTADFVVGKTWIEFFGLSGELRRYDKLKKDKIKIAQAHNMKMIEIYPRDIFPKGRLEQIFANLQY